MFQIKIPSSKVVSRHNLAEKEIKRNKMNNSSKFSAIALEGARKRESGDMPCCDIESKINIFDFWTGRFAQRRHRSLSCRLVETQLKSKFSDLARTDGLTFTVNEGDTKSDFSFFIESLSVWKVRMIERSFIRFCAPSIPYGHHDIRMRLLLHRIVEQKRVKSVITSASVLEDERQKVSRRVFCQHSNVLRCANLKFFIAKLLCSLVVFIFIESERVVFVAIVLFDFYIYMRTKAETTKITYFTTSGAEYQQLRPRRSSGRRRRRRTVAGNGTSSWTFLIIELDTCSGRSFDGGIHIVWHTRSTSCQWRRSGASAAYSVRLKFSY